MDFFSRFDPDDFAMYSDAPWVGLGFVLMHHGKVVSYVS